MVFASAMNVLMLAVCVLLFRGVRRFEQPLQKQLVWLSLTLLAVCGMAFLAAFVPGPIDRTNYAPAAFAVFGLLALLTFLGLAASIIRELRRGSVRGISFRLGGSMLCAMAALYVEYACANHYWFVRGNGIWVANVAGMGIPDLQCEDHLLVRWERDGAHYRCPRHLILGARTHEPFAPDYIAGYSVELGRRMSELRSRMLEFQDQLSELECSHSMPITERDRDCGQRLEGDETPARDDP